MRDREPHYLTGEAIHLGDKVRIDSTGVGFVVGIIGTDQYANGHKREHWDHYGKGILVEGAEFGLILYQGKDIDALVKILETSD